MYKASAYLRPSVFETTHLHLFWTAVYGIIKSFNIVQMSLVSKTLFWTGVFKCLSFQPEK